jgi:hypothetical protein
MSPDYTYIVPYFGYMDGYIFLNPKCFYVIYVPFLFFFSCLGWLTIFPSSLIMEAIDPSGYRKEADVWIPGI